MTELPLPSEIRSVMIPLQQIFLLLPNAATAEVIDFRQPEAHPDWPDWLLGEVDWRQRKLPIVQLESLMGRELQAHGVRRRIVVCHSLNPSGRRPFLGIVATAIPRLVRVSSPQLEELEMDEAEAQAPLHARVRYKQDEAFIPDLAGISREINQQI